MFHSVTSAEGHFITSHFRSALRMIMEPHLSVTKDGTIQDLHLSHTHYVFVIKPDVCKELSFSKAFVHV